MHRHDARGRFRQPAVAMMVLGTALALSPAGTAAEAVRGERETRAVADLDRYCTACWRNARLPADLWGDCTQDVLQRMLERVPTQSWPRALRQEGNERSEF